MDKLLKHALDGDATNFVDRFKGKMQSAFDDEHTKISKKVAADIAGVEVQEDEDQLDEGSTEDAEKTLKAIIGFLNKNGEGKDAKEMLKSHLKQ